MKRKLTLNESLTISSMLFGLFFGAGNLIFPAYMGEAAGKNVVWALLGFLVTGVGLPLLAIAALGSSHSDGVLTLSEKVSRKYGYFFTCALYLTIGPFFAIPRCFTVPF
jgi:LIVCS family branched-chain amino acid:cation transporter